MEHDPTGATTRLQETTLFGTPTEEPSDADTDPQLPPRLGRYVPLGHLGRGGMGVVHEAFDTKLARRVAIKVLPGGRRSINAEPRLRREARALAQLAHPNVVAIYDVGEANGTVFAAMELVEGRTLTQWQRARSRAWTEIVDAYAQAGEGLAAAHRQGLVHRDFKPDNAIIDPRGRVRVLDFGLAIGHETDEAPDHGDGLSVCSRLTMTGTVMGTPAYMAPEQIAGADADARSDQFSFCVALFEALFGARPFAGRTLREIEASIASGEVVATAPGRPVPTWLRRVVLRGLRQEPTSRWPDMRGLLRALARGRRRGRRRGMGLLGGGMLLAAAAVLAAPRADAADDPCEAAAARVEQAWGPAQRERAREAIVDSDLPFAADTWARVEPGLDRYAEQWSEARADACVAAKDELEDQTETQTQTQTQPVHDLRIACLEERRAELVALVELLGDADEALVARASSAVERLPSIAGCADPTGPTSAADPARVAGLRHQLARAHAFELAGHYADGRTLALEVAERAELLGDPATIAEAQLRVGLLHERSGAYPEAEQALSRAAWGAVEARHDAVAAEAMVQLTGVIGYLQARRVEGLEWGRHAEAAVARAGDDPLVRARLWNNLGATYDRSGDLHQAREHYARALGALDDHDGDDAQRLRATSLGNLGNARARLGELEQAHADLEQATADLTELRGTEHPEIAVMLVNLANIELDRGDLDQAERHYERALEIGERALGPEHPLVGAALLNLGVTLQARGEPERARPHLERAVALKEAAVGPRHHETALALNNLGETLREMGEPEAARQLHERSAEIVRGTLGADHPLQTFALTNLGLDLLAAGRPREAIEQLELTLVQHERSGAEPALRGICRLGLARAHQALGAEPPRVHALVHAAWQDLVDAPRRFEHERRAARQWLDDHAG